MDLTDSTNRQRGISVFEMLLIVAFLSILGSIGFITLSDVMSNAKQTKLLSDVKALNSAVLGYIASNGDLTSAKTPQDVISKLKRVSSGTRFNGLRQSFLDERIDLQFQTSKESETDSLRVYWNAAGCQFELASTGPPGIKGFTLRKSEDQSKDERTEERASFMSLAQEGDWIWDYVEAPQAEPLGPTVIPTTIVPPTSTAPMPVVTASILPPIVPLSDPIFSIPPGNYQITIFDLNVTILNPNPAGSSDLYYRVGFGSWQLYSGALLQITPDTDLQAQVIARDPRTFQNSSVSRGLYEASPILLQSPSITPDNPEFEIFGDLDISVSLADNNPPGTAILQFRVGGSPWMEYAGPFVLPATSFPGGADVEARAISTGSPYYLTSLTSREFIPIEGINLSGNTVGDFSNARGSTAMRTNLKPGDSSDYFEWGDGSGSGMSESWMEFYGGSFTDIIDGQQFSVGSLTYYNGTIASGSGADTVDLSVTLDLNINGRIFQPYFDFTFELVNTVNTADPIASADFVYLDDARSSRTLIFDGYEFEFALRFGDTTADGFSQFDRFNVIENRDASVNLYGTFNLLGPATDPGNGGNDPILGGLIIDDDPTTGAGADILYQKIGYQDPEQFVKSLLPEAEALAEVSKNANETAVQAREAANRDLQELRKKIDERKYFEALRLFENTQTAASLAAVEAARSEQAAADALPLKELAKATALNDPNAVEDAMRVADQADAAHLYSLEARTAAINAAASAAQAETAWNRIFQSTTGVDAEALAKFYADLAKAEESIANNSRLEAQNRGKEASDLLLEFTKKISEGKYFEAEGLYEKIAPAALLSRNAADTAENAATKAQDAAANAAEIALIETNATTSAVAANQSADSAGILAQAARAAADTAFAASTEADSVWANLLSTGATTNPDSFANYLADQAEALEESAKRARDDAKSASENAVQSAEESAKKFAEGKINESNQFEQQAFNSRDLAMTAADQAFLFSNESRARAVEADLIGISSVANRADSAADNAEVYAQEAQLFSDAATAATAALP